MAEGSTFLRHIPCPTCGSSDANALYDDGHTFCYACNVVTGGEGGTGSSLPEGLLAGREILEGLPKRGLTTETLKHFGYRIGEYRGETVHIAPYYDADRRLVAQHLRTANKAFPWLGDPKRALPFGAQCWPTTGRKLVVTEGELDALSMSQVQGNKWPVVSIGCGAGPQVRKYIAERRDYFLGFEEVVLMFDMDKPGREAARAAAEILGLRARIAELPEPYKDASDMLQAGKVEELISAMWKAKPYRPDGIVSLADLKATVLGGTQYGAPWPWPTLTKLTYGRRTGELYGFGGGTGTGKTDVFTTIMEQTVFELREPIGVFYLEQEPAETAKRIAGKHARRRFHVPQDAAGWTDEELHAAWAALEQAAPIHFYNSFGLNDWDPIRERMRYMRHALGVRHIFLDHLTALAATADDERAELARIMAEMGGLVKELDISLYFISHLATPEGRPHEEGGRVMLRHFKGARDIGFWAHFAFGLERDQQAEDEVERQTTTFRVLKDRYTGNATGHTFRLRYDPVTGTLAEAESAEFLAPITPFTPESF